MTALFEMRIRVGGDPRSFIEFTALRAEMGKLNHPACPDVDWAKIEQCCLALFERNGAELQTAAYFALARSHHHGLDGMAQGVALIEALVGEWKSLWPAMESARLDGLAWLFAQLQPLLRKLEIDPQTLPALVRLDTRLARLDELLAQQVPAPVFALQALRQQVMYRMQRVERTSPVVDTAPQPTTVPAPAWVMPVVMVPAPVACANTPRRRINPWLFAVAVSIAFASWLLWQGWLAHSGDDGVLADPVRLDSLSLFDAGSTELRAGSTKVLINALVDIKVQPGWLIVIAGHTDATGNAESNLQLSRTRAAAVQQWMQRMGDIPDSCFAVQGFGATQPIAGNDTEAGRTANRRVDIRLMPQPGACGAEGSALPSAAFNRI